jgi:hypothetical protein
VHGREDASGPVRAARYAQAGRLPNAVWLFANFGVFAPRNGTVITALVFCALAVAGSIFLILELNHPFEGLVKVSSAPVHYALDHLGQ